MALTGSDKFALEDESVLGKLLNAQKLDTLNTMKAYELFQGLDDCEKVGVTSLPPLLLFVLGQNGKQPTDARDNAGFPDRTGALFRRCHTEGRLG